MTTTANLPPYGGINESKSPTVQGRSWFDAMRISSGRKRLGDEADLPKTSLEDIKNKGTWPVISKLTALALTATIATAGAVTKGPEVISSVASGANRALGVFDDPETQLTKKQQEQKAAERSAADASAAAMGISDNPADMVGGTVVMRSPQGNTIGVVTKQPTLMTSGEQPK